VTKSEIQLIRSLEDKRAREEAGLFVAEGEKLVGELLASDLRVRKVYHAADPSPALSCLARNDRNNVDAERISAKEMERASRLKTPTDCLALVEMPRRTLNPASLQDRLTLALDGVQNPGNMGTIIRLADWFGIREVVCSADSADCWSPKVVQATMGAITRVAVHYGDLEAMIGAALTPPPSGGGPSGVGTPAVYGTFLEGENIYDATLSPGGIVVLGSEGRGISPAVERLVTRKLFIPPVPPDSRGSESLNVAIAAAIVCSEFRRRR
jgi:TrmH family RNA methyltransferase